MECNDLLAGPHEQGIGTIGTMGIGPDEIAVRVIPITAQHYSRTAAITGTRAGGRRPDASRGSLENGCSDLLAGPHGQGIGIMGIGPDGPDGPDGYCADARSVAVALTLAMLPNEIGSAI